MERGQFRIVTLRSGAHAVQHQGHGEVMHPEEGPWAEAMRLYVHGTELTKRLGNMAELSVWDVGLGAGTNVAAVLSAWAALKGQRRARLVLSSFEVDLDALLLALS